MAKPTICHPDRKHYAKGKCHLCYKREQYRPTPRVERKAECHPDRKHKAKGLRGPCIQKQSKRVGSGGVWGDLRRQGYPREGYRLLCLNCQFGTMRGKACPHQVAKEQIA